ncbi:MAG: Gfo/Idh/MocA family oxidoreductase [Rhodoferax sp.]|nr:Gfo/Idh/MocA family oxidoreductase [Rhodoferax sp.]
MSKTRLAVIGAGVIGRTHIDRICRSGNLTLAGIADPSEAGQVLARSLNVAWFNDYRSLLDTAKPQGAIVATPNATHVEIATDCLRRGIPALIEKPVADTVAEAQHLVSAQAQFRTPVLVGHHRRHNPINRRARDILRDGHLGRVVAASAFAMFLKPDAYFDVEWRRQAGGGPILINLIHDIDMLRFLVGEIVSVQAVASNAVRGFEVEDTAAAVLRFANGALGTVMVSDAGTSPWCWDFCAGEQIQYPRQNVQSHFITGTQGSLSLPDLALWNYRGERHWHAEMTREQTAGHQGDPYECQLQHFKAVIDGSETPLCSALDGLRTLQATLAVREAAATGQSASCTLPAILSME